MSSYLFIPFYLDSNTNKFLMNMPPPPELFPYAIIMLTLTKEHLNSATKFYNYHSYQSNGNAPR